MPRKDSREKILKAAMDAISERGMFALRMQDVGERVGMSPGHILYYYRSKQRLLLETLRWSEDRLAEPRARELEALATARARLERFIVIYLPTSATHPEWLLWLQAWALSAEDPEVASITGALNERWADDLAALVRFGTERGEFQLVDVTGFCEGFLAVLDGLSLHVLHDAPAIDPERAAAIALRIAADQLGFQAT
jgi:AcrR family transcriptional regulator